MCVVCVCVYVFACWGWGYIGSRESKKSISNDIHAMKMITYHTVENIYPLILDILALLV